MKNIRPRLRTNALLTADLQRNVYVICVYYSLDFGGLHVTVNKKFNLPRLLPRCFLIQFLLLKGPWTPKLTYHFPKKDILLKILTVIFGRNVLSTRRKLHLKLTIYKNDAENTLP